MHSKMLGSNPGTSDTSGIAYEVLLHEVLLHVFSQLDVCQVARARRVCKDWREIIDNNQALWRSLSWVQDGIESFRNALAMVEQKSKSSLESISIRERYSSQTDLPYLMEVLERCKSSLKEVSIYSREAFRISDQVPDLVTSLPNLISFILWDDISLSGPVALLSQPRERCAMTSQDPSPVKLKQLWILNGAERLAALNSDAIRSLSSLVSFAQEDRVDTYLFRSVIPMFSETIVHLHIMMSGIDSSGAGPLHCPNLRILEGL